MNLVQNGKIKKALFERWKELDLRPADVIRDAEERGMKITAPRLSRYKNGNSKEMITDTQLLWLCTRWGVFISYNIGEPKVVGGKIVYEVKPYNELKCLTMLEKLKPLFQNGKKQ